MRRKARLERQGRNSCFRVGEWRTDAGLNQISSTDGETRRLEPRVMELLVQLAQNPDVTLSREQILAAVWKGASVVDGVLARAVSELRTALGDDARNPRYVQTVPRRGYRLIARVEPIESDAGAATPTSEALSGSAGRIGRRPLLAWLLGLALVLAVASSGLRRLGSSADKEGHAGVGPGRSIESIAILGLEDRSTSGSTEYFGLGMTESLTATLARSRKLRVVAPHSAQALAGLDPRAAGARVGVDAVLTGSVTHENGDVGMTLQLIATTDGTVVWAGRFRQPMESVLAIQAEVARQVVREIQGELGHALPSQPAGQDPIVPEAFERTLEARYHLNQRSTAGMLRSRELFQEALLADSSYAPAWAGLAESYLQLTNYQQLSPQQAYPAAREAAERAISLDDTLPATHTALGLLDLHERWDLAAAETSYRRAIELGPSYAVVHQLYAELLSFQGRHEEALRTIRVARELDPFSTLLLAVEGVILLGAGLYDESITLLDQAYRLDPALLWTRRQRAYAKERLGHPDEAARARMAIPAVDEDSADRMRARVDADGLVGYYRWALEEGFGPLESTLKPATLVAECFAGVGDDEQALRWIERAVAEKGEYLLHLQRSPAFDRLRDHPRFRDPLVAVGVDPTVPSPLANP